MNDVEQLLKRQARWQKNRQSLTWPEKIRLAERVRESLRQWRVASPSDHAEPAQALKPRSYEYSGIESSGYYWDNTT